MVPEGNKASIKRYQTANIKQISLQLNKKTEADLLEYIESLDNKQGYIKALIRADMERNKTK